MKPLVSILIPTYNRPHYLEQALKSALCQTYPNIEIIICDNSEDIKTEKVVKTYQSRPDGSKIKYVRNEKNIGPIKNQHQCIELSSGEYCNYLMDDDLLHPKKIEIMAKILMSNKKVSLVTSRRKIIKHNGRTQTTLPKHNPLTPKKKKQTCVKGRTVIRKMLKNRKNHIGEPTTVLFRKADLKEPFGSFCGVQANSSVDVASWFTLLDKKNAVFLTEPLSSFRRHSSQLSNSTPSKIAHICDWIDFTLAAKKKGLLKDRASFIRMIQRLRKPVLKRFPKWNKTTHGKYSGELRQRVRLLAEACKKDKKLHSMGKKFKTVLPSLKHKKKRKK